MDKKPFKALLGKQVVTKEGKKIGIVKDITFEANIGTHEYKLFGVFKGYKGIKMEKCNFEIYDFVMEGFVGIKIFPDIWKFGGKIAYGVRSYNSTFKKDDGDFKDSFYMEWHKIMVDFYYKIFHSFFSIIFFLNQSIVLLRPSSRGTLGFHLSLVLARVISGCLFLGSSWGKGLNTILLLLSVSFIISFANSSIDISLGLPRLTGPVNLEKVNLYIPFTRSET